jgi:hypothetical protein
MQPSPSTDTERPSALRLFLIFDQIGLTSFGRGLGFMVAHVNDSEGDKFAVRRLRTEWPPSR